MQPPASEEVVRLPVALIDASPFQARSEFDEAELLEMGETIVKHGMLQPIIVRPKLDGRYELVVGERRLRATHLKSISDIPAFIRHYSDQEAAVVCSLENLQRRDLNIIERAHQIEVMLAQGLSLEQISQRIGKSVRKLQGWLDVLGMPLIVQQLLQQKKIGESQLNVITRLAEPADQAEAAELASIGKLSQRELKARTQHRPQKFSQRSMRSVNLDTVSSGIVLLTSHLQLLKLPDRLNSSKVAGVLMQVDSLAIELSSLRTRLQPPLSAAAAS